MTWLLVRLNVTGNEKLAPVAKAPVGRLEFDAVNKTFCSTKPVILVIAIFAVQVMESVFEVPIGTDPKSVGDVQVIGIFTGDP
jgi:hypothetical protein